MIFFKIKHSAHQANSIAFKNLIFKKMKILELLLDSQKLFFTHWPEKTEGYIHNAKKAIVYSSNCICSIQF